MKLDLGNFKIESDSLQFIVSEYAGLDKKELEKGNEVNRYKVIGYYTKLESALKVIPQEIIRTEDNLEVIVTKLEELYVLIERLVE